MLGQHLRGLHVIRAQRIGLVEVAGARSKHQRHAFFGGALAQLAAHARRSGDDYPVNTLIQQHIEPGKKLIGLATAVQKKDHPPLRFKRFG